MPPNEGRTTNTLTDEEKAQGWRLLFDGTSMEHWRGFKKTDVPAGWQVVDGTIHRADKGGDIVTRDQFDDFELQIEWASTEGGNSGIFFRVSEDYDAVWHTGPEMQILNNDVHKDGETPETRAGSNYALHAPAKEVCRPAGQWNHVRIVADGPHVEYWLNGEKVVAYEVGSEDWERRVAASKFAQHENYGRLRSGHIALQDHNDPVWFRNIKIRPLHRASGSA